MPKTVPHHQSELEPDFPDNSWGLGHSTPLLILGILILLVKQTVIDFYESISVFFEFGVAVMLLFLGLQVFWKMYRGQFHIHAHEHDGESHKHLHGSHQHEGDNLDSPHQENRHGFFPELIPFFRVKSYAIGIIHGLAGSAAVMLAILPTSKNFLSGFIFLVSFSLGTMISMAIMTVVMSFPFVVSSRSDKIGNVLISIAGVLSILLGIALGSDVIFETNLTGILWY